jgi:hypothetical protein
MICDEVLRRLTAISVAMIFAGMVACGGESAGTVKHVDVGTDASAGGGSSSAGLVACDDGTGNTDCCPPSALEGGPCDVNTPRCSRGGCHSGFSSYLYCGSGTWNAGHGLFPCSVDAGSDGSVSQMSCGDLHTAWSSFWRSHGQCTTDTDCTTFLAIDSSLSPCDAPPGLNQAINKNFVDHAQPYADRYFSLACGGDPNTFHLPDSAHWSDFGYDGTALVNPRCVSGLCSADSLSCNPIPPFDAGTTPCGTQTCATNQVCVQQMCGGGPNPCVPLPDAGTCPSGWTFDARCPRSTLGGCDPPPCTNPPPYCADVPKTCPRPGTVSGPLCPCADSVCKFGACVEMLGRRVTCAAQ